MSANDRGKEADSPEEIPPKGWMDIFKRVWQQLNEDHIAIVSAGVAFYFFLALFPALAALVSVYGLVVDPVQVEEQMSQLTAILPAQAHDTISGILQQLAAKNDQTLGWSMGLSVLISIWSAKKGMTAVFEGTNIAYDEEDKRNFFIKNGLALLFTLGAILVVILSMVLIVAVPAISAGLGLPGFMQVLLNWLRWPVLALIVVVSLGLIYRKAPSRDNPQFRWVSWGAVIATGLWILGSLLFSFFVNNFGSFDETYGSFAAIVVLMLWFFLTAFIILLGAEINAEMEHQTRRDTTVGEDEPMGQRNAYQADHVAES